MKKYETKSMFTENYDLEHQLDDEGDKGWQPVFIQSLDELGFRVILQREKPCERSI